MIIADTSLQQTLHCIERLVISQCRVDLEVQGTVNLLGEILGSYSMALENRVCWYRDGEGLPTSKDLGL